MSRSVALVLALLMTVPALAEDPVVEKRSEERIVGIRYTLQMRTGREIGGIVRVAGVFERRVRGVWEECDPEDAGAGVRLWYPKQQDGYTFHPIRQIKQLDEVGPVSADESASIQRARRAAQTRADEERAELKRKREEEARRKAEAEAAEKGLDLPDEEKKPSEDDEPTEDEAASDEEKEREARFEDLLIQYPPTDWKPDRPKKIERRRVVLGLFPSDEEKAFLEVYDEWKEAYAWWEAKIEAANDEKSEKTDEPRKGETRKDAGRGQARDAAKTADSRD